MKYTKLKTSAALAALSSVLLLSACGGSDDPVAVAAPLPAASAPTPPAPPPAPTPPASPPPPAPPASLAAPTLAFVMPQETLDLSNYTLTGKYALPIGSGSNLLTSEVSAVTYNADTDSLFVVGDSGTSIVQISKTGQLIDSMVLPADATKPQGTYFYDPEGLTYVGNGQFVIAEERYRQATLFTYTAGTTLDPSKVKTVKLGTTIGNIGLEGVTYDPQTRGFIFVKEKTPLGIFQTGIDFATGVATNGSATTENSTNLFDPALAGAVLDFGDVYALSNVLPATAPDYGALMVLSQESGKILKMNRAGKVLGSLAIEVSAQHEGITFDKQLNMYITNELGTEGSGEELWVYAPTRSATAVGIGSNLYLKFAVAIAAGSGNLILSNGAGDARTIAVTDATQVSFDGSTVAINPSADLLPGATYSIQYAAGAFKDAAGTLASAVNTPQTLAFTTVADITAPRLVATAPADNAIGVTGSRVVLTLSEAVKAGAGTITVSNGSDDVRTFAANDITQVTISGTKVDINPKADLRPGTAYFVLVSATALTDIAGNAFVGINDPTRLNFTTASSAVPTVLAAGDLLFIAANADSPDAFAFILMTGINAGTSVFFSDRDSLTATNESAYQWQADKAYPAGTVVTIQPDTAAGGAPLADKGGTFGVGGGLSATSETVFAFQGSIAGLSSSAAGALTVTNYIAALNIGGAAGPLDATLQAALAPAGAFASFAQDNVKYNGALTAASPAALRALIANPANWLSSDTVPFPITGGALFP